MYMNKRFPDKHTNSTEQVFSKITYDNAKLYLTIAIIIKGGRMATILLNF